MQDTLEKRETRGLKICQSCEFEMRDSDHFCRRCGTRWSISLVLKAKPKTAASVGVSTGRLPSAPLATAVLPKHEIYRPVSGSLLNAVASSVVGVSEKLHGKLTGKLIAVVLSLPIWLIIIVLSPFDAIVASKSLLRQF